MSGCVYKLTKTDTTEIYNTVNKFFLLLIEILFFKKVFNLFGDTNPLHADVFPDIRTMEAEVVRCVATLFHGDDNACGTVN